MRPTPANSAPVTNDGHITVVIPCYNRAATLPRAIATAQQQTIAERCTIIVVDDGSTDATPEIAARYDHAIESIRQPNQGPGAARNTGIRHARTEFVAFLDSDDEWHPAKLERQLALLRQWPAAVFCASPMTYLYPDHRRETVIPTGVPLDTPFDHVPVLLQRPIISTTTLVRRADLLAVGGFNPALRRSEDWDLWIRLGARGPALILSTADALYHRDATGSLADDQRQMAAAKLTAFRHVWPTVAPTPAWRQAWHRGRRRALASARDLAYADRDYAAALNLGLRAAWHSHGRLDRWEWGRLLAAAARLVTCPRPRRLPA